MIKQRRTFSAEFKLEAASLVLDEGYSSFDGGRDRTYSLIDQLKEQEPVELVCSVFGISSSSYYEYRQRHRTIDVERIELRSEIKRLFTESRDSAGSRTLMMMMRDNGYSIGRFKVRRLMQEAELTSKQPGAHKYKPAAHERPHLNREFDVSGPNQVWCGDITYIWAGSKWCYLAVIIDLHTRCVVGWAMSAHPDAALVIKALDRAYELRGKPKNILFHQIKVHSMPVDYSASGCGDIESSKV